MSIKQLDFDRENLFAALERSLAMILFDPNGNILDTNDNFADVIGYSKVELTNMHHRDLCLDEFTHSNDYITFWKNLRDNKAFHDKVERVCKNGNVIWLDATYTPIVNDSGKIEGIVKIATDITKQEAAIKNSSDEFMALVEEMTASTNEVHHATQQVISSMEKLNKESIEVQENVDNISSMATTVKNIASQSNLLGLNASIEAARAGEQGRGFSVVASEVRKMADTSKKSAEDISKQLEKIRNSVSAMVETVKQVTDNVSKNSVTIGELQKAYEHVTQTAEELSTIM